MRRESEGQFHIGGLEYPDHKLCQAYLFCDRTIDNVAVVAKNLGVKRGIGARYGPGLVWVGCGGQGAREFFMGFRFYGEIFVGVA